MKFPSSIGDRAFQLIAAIIGSSLIVTAITALGYEFNKPSIYFEVTPVPDIKPNSNPTSLQAPPLKYYVILARNDGRSSATNVTLSMLFDGKILHHNPVVTSEDLKEENIAANEGIYRLPIHIHRLASGAIIIYHV